MDAWIKLEVINEDERDSFKERHDSCGTSEFKVTKEQLLQLLEGKVIAMSDGEYCNFLSLKDGEE